MKTHHLTVPQLLALLVSLIVLGAVAVPRFAQDHDRPGQAAMR
jgi:hypothetical protein